MKNNMFLKTKKVFASLLSLALILTNFSSFNALAVDNVTEIYSLSTDSQVQELASETTGGAVIATPHLNQSGTPTYRVVDHPDGGNSIEVSNRGGTWYALDLVRAPLNLELGNLYTITIEGRIPDADAPADTQVIIGGADDPWNWLANSAPNAGGNFTVNLNVNHAILSDEQVERGFRFQTNNTTTFIIDEIIVNHIGTDPDWTPPADFIYSLAADDLIQDLPLETTGAAVIATPYLNQSGDPTFRIVEHPVSGNSIEVSNRADTWHTIDLVSATLNLELGNLYTITVSGRIPNAPGDTQFIIGGSSSPWGWLANEAPDATGNFSVTLNVNHTHLEDPQVASAFRFQTNNSATYIIDEIIVEYIGADPDWADDNGGGGDTGTPGAGDNVLRVETLGNVQWDGIQVPITALGLEAGNVYEFTFDAMIPVIPEGGIGLLLQTNGDRWEHIVFTSLMEAGEWGRFTGTLDLSNASSPLNFTHIQLVKDGYGPNYSANIVFFMDNFTVVNVETEEEIAFFDFENGQVTPFGQSGSAMLEVVSSTTRTLMHHITFGEDWAIYEEHSSAGSQMTGTRVTDFGRTDNYSFRLENVTGNYTSGAGNYFRLDLPEPLRMGGTYEISWWVYVPANENPGERNLVGPGIVLNSVFGTPANQPTNTQPPPGDLDRTTPMNEWFQTTVVFDIDHFVGDVDHLIFRFRVNESDRQPSVYFIDDIVINSLGADEDFAVPEWDLTLPSLAELYADYFLFGNILEPPLINNNPRNVIDMFLHHYNSVTAENAMKPDTISGGALQATRPDGLVLAGAETMVNFAEEHGLYMVGHTLIWHEQSALWQYRNPETGDFLTRSEAMENMRWFIAEYAGHFEGRIDAWDVTNEVFNNDGVPNNPADGPSASPVYAAGTWQRALRNYASWYQAFANGADFDAGERGWDYIYYSFVFARRYAPSALLIYNDFNEEMPTKRAAMAEMTEEFNERWANDAVNNPAYGDPCHPDYGRLLIEVIGMQAHYNENTNLEHVRDSIDRFIATGARVHVTELDIQFTNIAAPFEMSPEQEQQQADMFGQLFRWYLERAEHIDRVAIWGREDGSSWRGNRGATHFDRNYNPKLGFFAIVDPFDGGNWPAPPPPVQPPPVNPDCLLMLDAPTNLEIADGVLTWNPVAGAVGYRIYVNGVAVTTIITGTSFDLTTLDLDCGTHRIQVRAITDDEALRDSSLSAPIEFEIDCPEGPDDPNGPVRLPAPRGFRLIDGILTWPEVPGAIGYRVYVNGIAVTGIITGTSFDTATLDCGRNVIQVRAIGDGEDFLNSALSSRIILYNDCPEEPDPEDPEGPIRLPAPRGFRLSNGILTWLGVPNAIGYRVYVNGVAVTGIITGTSFDTSALDCGINVIQVRAIGDGEDFLNSLLSSGTIVYIDCGLGEPECDCEVDCDCEAAECDCAEDCDCDLGETDCDCAEDCDCDLRETDCDCAEDCDCEEGTTTPGTPITPGAPSTPGTPIAPGAPSTPGAPGVPPSSSTPEAPEAPPSSSAPGAPGVPPSSSAPGAPTVGSSQQQTPGGTLPQTGVVVTSVAVLGGISLAAGVILAKKKRNQ